MAGAATPKAFPLQKGEKREYNEDSFILETVLCYLIH